jgi:hypothetical protein
MYLPKSKTSNGRRITISAGGWSSENDGGQKREFLGQAAGEGIILENQREEVFSDPYFREEKER